MTLDCTNKSFQTERTQPQNCRQSHTCPQPQYACSPVRGLRITVKFGHHIAVAPLPQSFKFLFAIRPHERGGGTARHGDLRCHESAAHSHRSYPLWRSMKASRHDFIHRLRPNSHRFFTAAAATCRPSTVAQAQEGTASRPLAATDDYQGTSRPCTYQSDTPCE